MNLWRVQPLSRTEINRAHNPADTLGMPSAPLPREVTMPKPSWRDRRRGVREVAAAPAVLRPLLGPNDPGSALPPALVEQNVMLRNVSEGGIGLRGRLALDLLKQYQIQCDDPNVCLRTNTLRIVSCRREPDGMYEIGAELLAA